VSSYQASSAITGMADEALLARDRALKALDEGDPVAALRIAGEGLAVLEAAGLGGGPDAAAVLVARAEIEESLGRFGDAAATAAAALAFLEDVLAEDVVAEDGAGDTLLLWCQAQERLAALERLAGDFDAAAARLSAARSLAAAETLDMAAAETPDLRDGPDGSGPRYDLAAAVLRMHAERMNLGKRERRLAEHFTSAHPAIPVAEVVAQPEDVHDLDGLRVIGTILSQQSP